MELEVAGTVWHWRGPSPYHFVALPPESADAVRSLSSTVTYGWGVVPVRARVGATDWRTSLIPKDGTYLLPLRDSVRRAEGLAVGDQVDARLTIGDGRGPRAPR